MTHDEMRILVLKHFAAYLNWINSGAKTFNEFDEVEDNYVYPLYCRGVAICGNLYNYLDWYGVQNQITQRDIFLVMKALYCEYNLDSKYPFGMADYEYRDDTDTFHKCPLRIEFLTRVVNETKGEVNVVEI